MSPTLPIPPTDTSSTALAQKAPEDSGRSEGIPAWISQELIDLTRKIFEPRYKASLCLDEVVRILQGVGTLLDVVLHPIGRRGELAS